MCNEEPYPPGLLKGIWRLNECDRFSERLAAQNRILGIPDDSLFRMEYFASQFPLPPFMESIGQIRPGPPAASPFPQPAMSTSLGTNPLYANLGSNPEERERLLAIHENPEDDAPRLTYADWLDANSHADRAEFIRASCAMAQIHSGDERWKAASDREYAAWRSCRPAWWDMPSNITGHNERGIYRLTVGETSSSRATITTKRLGKTPWVGQAFNEGWLLRLEVHSGDGDTIPAVAKWKVPAASIPLFIRSAPQNDDGTLQHMLAIPQLLAIDLPSYVLRQPSVRALSQYPRLREITIEVRNVENDTVDAVFAHLAVMPEMRRLRLRGHEDLQYGNRPNDQDLLVLQNAPALQRLILSDSPAVTGAGIEALKRARPQLIVERAYG
jgi:uncharacterized protein (TIGR02996 family)